MSSPLIYPATPPELVRNETPPPSLLLRPKGSESPEPNCAICLSHLNNMALTDSCFHKFCYECLHEWSKIKASCPLCKISFKAIFHSISSESSYLTTPIVIPEPPPPPLSRNSDGIELVVERSGSRLVSFLREMGRLLTIPPGTRGPSSRHHRRRGFLSDDFRRDIYTRNLWVDPDSLSDVSGQFRDCSPEWFRNNPATTHRLYPFLTRELRVLIRDESEMDTVLSLICELIRSVGIRSRGFYEALTPYLEPHTEHFQHEFFHYARCTYDIIGYDRNAIHISTFSTEESDHSSDAIVIVDEIRRDISEYSESLLTPSTSSGETHLSRSRSVIPIHTSSEDSEDSNAESKIEVVDVVNKTPEIIDLTDDNDSCSSPILLSSSEAEETNVKFRGKRRKKTRMRNSEPLSLLQLSFPSSSASGEKGKGKGKKSSERRGSWKKSERRKRSLPKEEKETKHSTNTKKCKITMNSDSE